MKLFKRFAAALLAGVMVLAMLTACGGGAGGGAPKTNEQKAEDTYLFILNTMYGTSYQNNSELQNEAKSYLQENLDDNGKLKDGKDLVDQIGDVDEKNNLVTVVCIIPDSNGDPQGLTADDLSKFDDEAAVKKALADVKDAMGSEVAVSAAVVKAYVKAIGVGSVKKGDKYYVAVVANVDSAILGE